MTVGVGRTGKLTDQMRSRLAANNVYIAIDILLKKVSANMSVARVRSILQLFFMFYFNLHV